MTIRIGVVEVEQTVEAEGVTINTGGVAAVYDFLTLVEYVG